MTFNQWWKLYCDDTNLTETTGELESVARNAWAAGVKDTLILFSELVIVLNEQNQSEQS